MLFAATKSSENRAVLSAWVPDVSRDEFFAAHFQRAPLARAGTGRQSVPLLNWGVVAQLADARPDTLVVRNGDLRRDPPPQSFEEAMALFRQGYSLVMRRCERHHPALRALADAVGRELEGEVSIQTYITPAGFRSFGWHYDCEDVFVVQTGGVKEFFLRENTVNPQPCLHAMPRDMQYEKETTPAMAATLAAGDVLYIPRGWWHVARSVEESLSLSIGVLAPGAA
jgi:50S ribosomal protein L16 3-hydroxylase